MLIETEVKLFNYLVVEDSRFANLIFKFSLEGKMDATSGKFGRWFDASIATRRSSIY